MAKVEVTSLSGGVMSSGSTNVVSNLLVRLQSGTDRLLYATWTWNKKNTDKYKVTWKYYTDQGVWFIGNESDESGSSSSAVRATYTAPNNATKVSCTVLPVSKTYTKKSKGKEVTASYWKATSKTETYTFNTAKMPAVPATPTVSITAQYTLTASLSVSDENTDQIEFEVVQDNRKTYSTAKTTVITQYASYNFKVAAGSVYKVRARAIKKNGAIIAPTVPAASTSGGVSGYGIGGTQYEDLKSIWSEYSSSVSTVPLAPSKIKKHTVVNETTIFLEWDSVGNSGDNITYTVEYTVTKNFFDHASSVSSVTVNAAGAYIENLGTGQTWYFRVKASNSQGDSGWSPIYSVILGVVPTAPTTWTDISAGVVGDTVHFYWMHNSEDGSSQTAAEIQIAVDNGEWETKQPTYMSTTNGEASYLIYQTFLTTEEDLVDHLGANVLDSNGNVVSTSVYTAYAEGVTIRWRVRTKGVLTTGGDGDDGFSPWSTERVLVLYGPPSIALVITDDETSELAVYSYSSFPIYLNATASPNTQNAISWVMSVVANESYQTYDEAGRITYINAGDEIHSEYINGNGTNILSKVFSAGDIDFENEKSYTITVRVAMSSGMTTEASQVVSIDWEASILWPNAEVSVDPELLCAYIRPYCTDDEDNLIENVTLSVYRRDYDGRFTEIATGLDNSRNLVITDPHPSLDFARYRIVATSTVTGQIGYYDLPGEEVSETGLIIQWDEVWSNFNIPSGDGDGLANSAWAGSMLRLPYNVKVSESSDIDKNLIEYIGRSAPVSYYGTQLGVGGTWSSEFPATDVDTRYALRRLQIWRGDAYVREPNGVGYWASINVSFNKDYNNLLIPVTLDITRVEGGI